MPKRLWLTAGLVVALSTFSASTALGQKVTMEWQNAPLNHVVRAFAAFSQRTIVVAPDVGNPEVTASVADVEWQRALDLVLLAHGLVARVDATGVIHIERLRAGK
jgi:type II secretory pathway component HofQ